MDKVTLQDGSAWSSRTGDRLIALWREGLPAEQVGQAIGRSEAQVRAKAADAARNA